MAIRTKARLSYISSHMKHGALSPLDMHLRDIQANIALRGHLYCLHDLISLLCQEHVLRQQKKQKISNMHAVEARSKVTSRNNDS